jgi:hypothetical protein
MRDDHVFIMAPPRSGTKMLARALARCPDTYLITEHKKKASVPEERNLRADREFWQEAFGLKQLPLEEVEFDAKAFAHLNDLWNANAGGKRLIIKNPNNVVRAREIRRAFPNAQFLWLLRNPWAVIQSMFGGNEAGGKTPMFLGASEVLKHEDPFLRAAASWVYAVQVMKQIGSGADIVTRYEDLVAKPQEELRRIADHLSLTFTERAAEVPQMRAEDFRVARYLLRRSPAGERTIEIVAPIASELGYPERPRGFPGDDRIFSLRYLLTCLRRPHKTPPYGFPRLQRMSAAVRRLRAKFVPGKIIA